MDDNFLEVAKQAALEAGEIISKYIGNNNEKFLKQGDQSNFATRADLEAEQKIVEILQKNFPSHNIIAEEKTNVNNKSPYTWVIDPLDGTFSFTHGVPYFCVSIGLIFNNQPILGVVNQVALKNLFYAQKNSGAFLNDKPIKVSNIDSLETSACGLDFGHKKEREKLLQNYVMPLINKIGYPYSVGSAVGCQMLVAQGILEGYVNEAWLWDFAAATIIIREAGGKVTDFAGNEPDWTQLRQSIIASNGLIHGQILEGLKK